MELRRRTVIGMATGILALGLGTAAFAAGGTINVSLWDSGEHAMDDFGTMQPMVYGMPEMDMSTLPMGITVDVQTVSAGDVTFDVTNDSTGIIHEMIVAPAPVEGDMLPYDDAENRVTEEETTHRGEVSELDPGAKGSLTLTLEPGTYILYCNIPGHYVMGMWTTITVTE
jgi:uncharacterized cupredoxin-like copper-binding protein